jgi:hypothetical protein
MKPVNTKRLQYLQHSCVHRNILNIPVYVALLVSFQWNWITYNLDQTSWWEKKLGTTSAFLQIVNRVYTMLYSNLEQIRFPVHLTDMYRRPSYSNSVSSCQAIISRTFSIRRLLVSIIAIILSFVKFRRSNQLKTAFQKTFGWNILKHIYS